MAIFFRVTIFCADLGKCLHSHFLHLSPGHLVLNGPLAAHLHIIALFTSLLHQLSNLTLLGLF